MSPRSLVPLAAALVLVAGGAAGCASNDSGSASSSSAAASATTAEPASSTSLTVTDPWAKAAESGMTAAFGTLVNATDADVTVVSATTSASDRTELHETVMKDGQMVMQPKEGGFVVPAGGELVLEPGGSHIMIMDLTSPVAPGDDVTVTLTLDDGSTVEFVALAKDYAGGNETYQPMDGMSEGASMSEGM
ncbi:MAG: copper chaperone PCu(A)C [Candidatus Nanopelagicales bacterium]